MRDVARNFDISIPTLRTALNNLKALGIAKEISGKGKERLYIHENHINQLEQGPFFLHKMTFNAV